ncbi:MAG: helix-turn-helix domain-containing protein [Propionibacteriaceae bacterium]|jgi:excisionase family DNA binding protein|nr:helix-turn-helix domain-containing protein [Propionibacteriaceae bacterium]
MSVVVSERVTIPAASVKLNPTEQSDWAKAVFAFVSQAAEAGKDVELAVLEETYSPAEVARLVGVSKSGIHRRIESGDIQARKVGSRYRISANEVRRYRQRLIADLAGLLADDF